MKHPAKIDIAVLLLFFNRPDSFEKVFAQVRKARPSRLFLYQDGPRGEQDLEGIMACRRIAQDIDWECDVRRQYQERNYGCDPSGYLSHRWAFSMADKCIVLEDDVVPAQSFFPFCKEMLDRYEHDQRVWMVAGFNTDEQSTDIAEDYFFTSAFSIWGWASWRRVIEQWDESYSFLNNPQTLRQLRDIVKQKRLRSDFLSMCQDHRASGRPYFESIFWASMILNSALAIMPRRNQVNNIGLTENSTHFSSNLKTTPQGYRRIFTMQRFELTFPLQHPPYVVENIAYKNRLYRRNAWGHPWIKIARGAEELLLNLRYGQWTNIRQSIARRIQKWLGLSRHV